jgi:hypothetical protein
MINIIAKYFLMASNTFQITGNSQNREKNKMQHKFTIVNEKNQNIKINVK